VREGKTNWHFVMPERIRNIAAQVRVSAMPSLARRFADKSRRQHTSRIVPACSGP
jgi:hypothetical protein